MKIAVLIKQTPDTEELPTVTVDDVQRGEVNGTLIVNPWDEFAAEEAILLGERFDADTVAIALGNVRATDALKHVMAMGVAEAKLIDRSGLPQGDIWITATLLAAAVEAEGEVDLVLTGRQSVDENNSAVYVGVARKLGWTLLSNVTKLVDIADGRITVERLMDGVQETVAARLPAVVSVSKEINEPRHPGFMGIRKANRAEIPLLTPADLGVTNITPQSEWTNLHKPITTKSSVRMIDGATAQEKAANLVDALLADKVL